MNIYDRAHALAGAIKAAPEYKNFKKAGEKLAEDQSAKEMLADLRNAQLELQKQKLSGLEVAPEQEKRLSQMFEVVNLNMVIKEYMQAEYRFSVMLADIQKIISEAIEELIAPEISEVSKKQPSPGTK